MKRGHQNICYVSLIGLVVNMKDCKEFQTAGHVMRESRGMTSYLCLLEGYVYKVRQDTGRTRWTKMKLRYGQILKKLKELQKIDMSGSLEEHK